MLIRAVFQIEGRESLILNRLSYLARLSLRRIVELRLLLDYLLLHLGKFF